MGSYFFKNCPEVSLNGTSTDQFYGSLDARIKSMIKSVKWYKGKIKGSWSYPPKSEPTDEVSNSHPIGLMYASDYYNSWGEYSGDFNNPNTDSWLFRTHGISAGDTMWNGWSYEWTMTRYGINELYNAFVAWSIDVDGNLPGDDISNVDYNFSVRPAFYLKSDVKLTGEGTEGNPYIPN